MTDLPARRHVFVAPVGRPTATTGADPLVDRLRRPVHVGALFGISASLYATTLAGVAVLQQRADDEVAAARAPSVAQVEELRAMNRRLAEAVNALSQQEQTVSGEYDALRSGVDAAEATLSNLAGVTGDVRGAAAALPQRIALPAVPRGGSIHAASAPAHATSGGTGK